ncbi:DMT family transporter [Pseudodesulfovibrio thermohalotolerans]|uniref:DMT family transporter n=1 Tax=Pseudodesulfovibrio thermohalotolerans TaxID=2880651 RepID=UPI002443726B|nr:DMT family transporter [Pseudodesulfovibrio thermohalotolerans]WFS62523.1 DMT family transporter [Pseudodesulfovibrio thermohalotolerans]
MTFRLFRHTQAAGYFFITLGIMFWSGNFVAARGLAQELQPATINLLRWILATLIFLPFGWRAFWREREAVLRHWKVLSLLALTGISLYDTVVFMAGHTTGTLNMSLIATLSPLLTALTAQFLYKERIGHSMYLGIAVSSFGVAYLVTGGQLGRLLSLHFTPGDLLILSTTCMSAVYNTAVSKVANKLSQTTLFLSISLLGTLYLVPLYLWETGGRITLPPISGDVAVSLIYLAVLASILCFLFWNSAVQILGAPKAMLFYYTLPPVSALIAWFVIDEPVNRTQLLSGALILGGIFVALYEGAPRSAGKGGMRRQHAMGVAH